MKRTWAKLGGQLGLGCAALGVLAIGLAWNGAAGVDFVSGQIPYLLSGGFFGLALVMIGVSLVVVQNTRRDRAIIEGQLQDLNNAIARLANALGTGLGGTNGSGSTSGASSAGSSSAASSSASLGSGMVVVGSTSFHRPDCRLATGKDLAAMPVQAAMAEGLSACRICDPTGETAELEPTAATRATGAATATRRRRTSR
ncbi:MAG: hypothetical protein QOI20_1813 [Acidimicrobiaceae bacterium]|jgi:hypothetical protein|nr:hypothetical protein [Acidimicrobiaceae bacterium]